MSEKWRKSFPARSRLERKKRIYNCCLQLDYEAYVSGTSAERDAIYLEGLRGCGPALAKLGATHEQIVEFERILDDTLQAVTRIARLLAGLRGCAPGDTDALAAAIAALSQRIADPAGEASEIEINPLFVHPPGGRVTAGDCVVHAAQNPAR